VGWSAGRSAPVAAARYPADPSISPTSLAAARFAASATCFTRAIDSARWGSSAAAGPFPDPPLDAIADGAEALETPRATSILRRRVDRPTVVSARGALGAEIFQTVTLDCCARNQNTTTSHGPRPLLVTQPARARAMTEQKKEEKKEVAVDLECDDEFEEFGNEGEPRAPKATPGLPRPGPPA
jgi:hypothetical protein